LENSIQELTDAFAEIGDVSEIADPVMRGLVRGVTALMSCRLLDLQTIYEQLDPLDRQIRASANVDIEGYTSRSKEIIS